MYVNNATTQAQTTVYAFIANKTSNKIDFQITTASTTDVEIQSDKLVLNADLKERARVKLIAQMSDGYSQNISHDAEWSVSDVNLLQLGSMNLITGTIYATAQNSGHVSIRAKITAPKQMLVGIGIEVKRIPLN